MEHLKEKIRTIPHFPKQGIMFRDVTTLFKDPQGFTDAINALTAHYKTKKIDKVLGIESRGFIIGGALAHQLGVGFIPARKPGKLPAQTIKAMYTLEYGTDTLEIHTDALQPGENVLIIDDLIATGGTCLAAAELVEKCGSTVAACAFIIELPDLNGRKKLEAKGYAVHSLVTFAGE